MRLQTALLAAGTTGIVRAGTMLANTVRTGGEVTRAVAGRAGQMIATPLGSTGGAHVARESVMQLTSGLPGVVQRSLAGTAALAGGRIGANLAAPVGTRAGELVFDATVASKRAIGH